MDILIDSLIDLLKLLPFLFFAFLIIELFEHKFSDKTIKFVENTKFGPLIGSILGIIPQCGFSAMATNLYVTRIISLGTLISIYLSTSDEMLPILISENVGIKKILPIILIKFLFGLFWGIIIDLIYRKEKENYKICEECDCENENIIISSLKHTFKTCIFIFIINLGLNILFSFLNDEQIASLFMKDSYFSIFISSLIGLIPNCGASVAITELYVKGVLSLATCMSGLLTNSGISILILFKTNKNKKENIKILLLLYIIGIISGFILKTFVKI